nr:NF-X1-type zinc finger protein NFXL1-like [Tanacetum cinerariifolium]
MWNLRNLVHVNENIFPLELLIHGWEVVDMSSYQARYRRPRYPNSNHRQAWIQRGPTTAATMPTFVTTTARDANTSPSSNSNSQNDPPSDPYLTPHSCGEPCGKAIDIDIAANASYDDDNLHHCRHRYVVQCHPSPCPSCMAFAPPKMCLCGKKTITIRCSDPSQKSLLTCGHRCGNNNTSGYNADTALEAFAIRNCMHHFNQMKLMIGGPRLDRGNLHKVPNMAITCAVMEEASVINQCTQLLTPSANPTYVMTYIYMSRRLKFDLKLEKLRSSLQQQLTENLQLEDVNSLDAD